MSSCTTLKKLIDETISKQSDRSKVKIKIKKSLQELTFIKLQVLDPSYKLRYQYALNFWRDKTANENIEMSEANKLIGDLKEELNSKHCIHSDVELEQIDKILLSDGFFSQESPTGKSKPSSSTNQSSQNMVWYVTSKCKNKIYVKSTNSCEVEKAINIKEEIFQWECCYELIYPGDEVKITPPSGPSGLGDKPSIDITKSNGLGRTETHDDKATFIREVLNLFSQGEAGLTVYNTLYTRYKGIWGHIKNDKEFFKDIRCVKDVIELSCRLSDKLSKKRMICQQFLEDISLSLFFISVLPKFIERNASEPNSDVDYNSLKSLLEFIMEFSPKTASKTWNVAKELAKCLHIKKENSSECEGVEFLAQLGQILAKAVSGHKDVDTTNCEWNDLPIIPTKTEIFSAFDLKSLDPIKRDEPYESPMQYLDINFRLLREECFRDLCSGIQDFREYFKNLCSGIQDFSEYNARKMKVYRITLDTIQANHGTQIILVLKCENFLDSSEEEEEGASNEILYGSLMCISLKSEGEVFDSLIWATAVDSEVQRNRKMTVSVSLCADRNEMENIDVLLELLAITKRGEHALMAESPTFYRAFGPCMDGLKQMFEQDNMPLVDELVFAKKLSPPEYTHDKEQDCDWNIIFKKPAVFDFAFPDDQQLSPIEQFKHLQEQTIETSQMSILDETQLLGIKNFLENRVSLIQGPPGTGKSFLGTKILRLMLSMGIPKRYGGPILVMTYKNSALDHFLESCLEHICKIVRIGYTKSEKLTEHLLWEVLKKEGHDKDNKKMLHEASARMWSSRCNLKRLFKCLSNSVLTFLEAASTFHIRSLLTMSEDDDQNIDEAIVNKLLRKWKRSPVPEELKEYLKNSLMRWLPTTKTQERFQDCMKEAETHHRKNVQLSSTEDGEGCSDSIDKVVEDRERKQDAVEDVFMRMEEQEDDLDDNEPLDDDINIPFDYKKILESTQDVEETLNLWELPDEDRLDFICALQLKIVREFIKAVTIYEDNGKYRQDIVDDNFVKSLKNYHVIGMTVTGAATRLHLLDQLKPCAVIVEEAAEIIEGQLISVLPPTIKHLIMLGDQEQLRPRVNCYKLATEKHLDCSMFERLINNNLPCVQLGQQCRMRDDIAEVLRSLNIYKCLKTNNEKTGSNHPPDCIGKSLYFVKHTTSETRMIGSSSLWNHKEIGLILDVAVYLMKNGYAPSDVTVLCPYRGQVEKMKSEFKKKSLDPSQAYLTKLRDVNITTVDSFQGEENKVILLSLVRSNREQKIGFFARSNRICVAVSRARCALYMFGNSSVYYSSKNWKTIIKFLEDKGLVGSKFPFKEEFDRITTEKDGGTRKLSTAEVTRLGEKIVSKWQHIAGLANLDKSEIDNVQGNNVEYPKPIEKAIEILHIINNKPDFSREKLGEHLKEAGFDDLVDEVLKGTPDGS